MHLMLNGAGAAVRAGRSYVAGQSYDDILEGYRCSSSGPTASTAIHGQLQRTHGYAKRSQCLLIVERVRSRGRRDSI
jgi:hypothetical protein